MTVPRLAPQRAYTLFRYMSYSHCISSQYGLIWMSLHGAVSASNLIAMLAEVAGQPDYDRSYHVVLDLRESELKLEVPEQQALARTIPQVIPATRRRVGIIATNPRDVALAMLYRSAVGEDGCRCEVFSTVEAATAYTVGRDDIVDELLAS